MGRQKAPPQEYQPQFDGLRAIAVLTVMLDHFGADIPDFPLPDSVHLGATGVRLFLVLSGYFITASLCRTRDCIDADQVKARTALGVFYRRRFLRILPAYGLFAVVGLALNVGAMREHAGWLLTGTVNWLIAWRDQWPLAISHLWSICVQEQFYLVWPFVILFLPRRWILHAIVTAAIAGIAFRIGCVLLSAPLISRWVLPFGSLDSLGAGALLGWWGGRLLSNRTRWPVAIGCVLMLSAAAYLRNGDATRLVSVLVEPLEACALVLLVARTVTGFNGWIGRLLTLRGLVYAGQISYGLYIYHILISVLVDRWLPEPGRWLIDVPAMRLLTLSAATLLAAVLSWRLIEQPINRLRGASPRLSRQPV